MPCIASRRTILGGGNFRFSVTEVIAPGGKNLSGVQHDLGVVPDLIVGFMDASFSSVSNEDIEAFIAGRTYKDSTTWNNMVARCSGSVQHFRGVLSGLSTVSVSETEISLASGSYFFRAGIPYYIIAVAME